MLPEFEPRPLCYDLLGDSPLLRLGEMYQLQSLYDTFPSIDDMIFNILDYALYLCLGNTQFHPFGFE